MSKKKKQNAHLDKPKHHMKVQIVSSRRSSADWMVVTKIDISTKEAPFHWPTKYKVDNCLQR